MAWVTPPVFVSGNALTASQLNILSGDLNETAVAKATAAGGQLFVSTGLNALSARQIGTQSVITQETTTSTGYADLATAGPLVVATTGTQGMVWFGSSVFNSVATAFTCASFEVSDGGGTYQAANDNWAVIYQPPSTGGQIRAASALMLPALHAASNTFKMKYRASAGTGTFERRSIMVLPM